MSLPASRPAAWPKATQTLDDIPFCGSMPDTCHETCRLSGSATQLQKASTTFNVRPFGRRQTLAASLHSTASMLSSDSSWRADVASPHCSTITLESSIWLGSNHTHHHQVVRHGHDCVFRAVPGLRCVPLLANIHLSPRYPRRPLSTPLNVR